MNSMVALLIPANLTSPMIPVPVRYTMNGFCLQAVRSLLKCDTLETVRSLGFPDCLLWCDSSEHAVPNTRASILACGMVSGNVMISSSSMDGIDRDWCPNNPLPWVPCNLQHNAELLESDPVFQSTLNRVR